MVNGASDGRRGLSPLKLLEATRARGADDVLAGAGGARPQGPGGSSGAQREGDVRRGRVPPSWEHVRRRAGRGPHRAGGTHGDGRVAAGARREAVHPRGAQRHGGMAPRGPRGLPEGREPPDLGCTGSRVRLLAPREEGSREVQGNEVTGWGAPKVPALGCEVLY